ncbi:hypothetical protein DPMN_035648 [Dreissena polymorpha]|uniref:Uncharacterized protein n=1 Tax=Dreissena polymorpha TaxID=45954 RepID=A0A9D4RN43_DREPO|nr:hypothetical protein DPMN_035648 [Dreissena polymorpha]
MFKRLTKCKGFSTKPEDELAMTIPRVFSENSRANNMGLNWLHAKEHFLVPDHTIKDISGASFAGFYYICFQKSTATIEGYYYHRSSEWYQSLNLTHVPEHSISVYQFR